MLQVPTSTHTALGGNCEVLTSLQIIRRFLAVKSSVVLIIAATAFLLAVTEVTDACIATAHMSPTSFPAMKCFLYRPKTDKNHPLSSLPIIIIIIVIIWGKSPPTYTPKQPHQYFSLYHSISKSYNISDHKKSSLSFWLVT
jgi:hypothetical protein